MVTVNGNAAEFCFFQPEAGHVWLVGDFNNWRPEELKMMRQANGDWLSQLQLAPGEYRFHYLADGQIYIDYAAFGIEIGQWGFDSVVRITDGTASS
jgi:1,4-alpha-glucan branching enzyme